MDAPIKTTIINNTATGRTVYWTAKGLEWLNPKAATEIDYEPCSVASKKQLTSILEECRSGAVSLILHIKQADGSYMDVPYNPAADEPAATPVQPVQTEPKIREQVVDRIEKDERDHIINAKQEHSDQIAERIGVTAEPVVPPTVEPTVEGETLVSVEGSAKEGFDKSAVEAADTVIADSTDKTYYAVPQEDPKSLLEETFAELVEQKEWQKALDLLISVFGEDKITFTTRTIMSLKSLDKIKEKYNL